MNNRRQLLAARGDAISIIRNIEAALGIPPAESALRSRAERRAGRRPIDNPAGPMLESNQPAPGSGRSKQQDGSQATNS